MSATTSFFTSSGVTSTLQNTFAESVAAAQTAQAAAEVAQTAAEAAQTAAENARDTANTHATNAQSSAASTSTAETNSATSATNAANSEANAATSETNAATSETNAATSATTAATSETNAATSETNAATSATNAATSETNAAASETAAVASETAAAASETAAAASETAAATSETNAATSETNASTSATAAAASAASIVGDAAAAAASATAAGNSATSAATSASAASASQTAAALSAASAANSYDLFDDRYLGSKTSDPTLDNDGNALAVGALYFNSAANEMRVYDGGNWIPASSAGTASFLHYNYTATSGQTTFSGVDDNANTLSYVQGNLFVILNGVILEDGADYTANDGTSIVLTQAAALNDELTITAFKSFTSADMVSSSQGGTFYNDVAMSGGDLTFGDNDKAIFGAGSDLQIYHSGAGNYISDQGVGPLNLLSGGVRLKDTTDTETMLAANAGGSVTVYYDNSAKLATTATGVNVTGTVTADGLTVDGIGVFSTASPNIRLDETDTVDLNTRFRGQGGVLKLETTTDAGGVVGTRMDVDHSTGDISFYDTSGNAKFFWDASAESLGIGTSNLSSKLTIEANNAGQSPTTSTNAIRFVDTDPGLVSDQPTGSLLWETSDTSDSGIHAYISTASLNTGAASLVFGTGTATSLAERLRIDSSGNVGIGTTSPSHPLTVKATDTNGTAMKIVGDSTNSNGRLLFRNSADTAQTGQILCTSSGNMTFENASTEAMRINSSGSVLVGTTDSSLFNNGAGGNEGVMLSAAANIQVAKSGAPAMYLNRLDSDGEILRFSKNGATGGSIGVEASDLHIDGPVNHTGIRFVSGHIRPRYNGADADNTIDLGIAAFRFDDIFATNGTIQTSDANEKQQIAALTAAEITAATAISKLFKTFKWNDKVAEKGDAARTHTGVIAQQVETAMTDAGLDAGDYAFFISSTWWETQTDVPAVEAADAVLDDDGNVVTEAIEAVDAYTRTDTYDTAEEAPEGAVERTRLGIRYPELLAFIGAATEQRLADIETRLDALENA